MQPPVSDRRRLTAASNDAAIFRCLGTPFSDSALLAPPNAAPLSCSSVIDVQSGGTRTHARIINPPSWSRPRLITYRALDRDTLTNWNAMILLMCSYLQRVGDTL